MEDPASSLSLVEKRRMSSSSDHGLDANRYMDINEFMEALEEIELITPFGKVPAIDYKQEVLSQVVQSNRSELPYYVEKFNQQTKTTAFQKNVRTKKSSWSTQQRNQRILEEAVLESYVLLLRLSNPEQPS